MRRFFAAAAGAAAVAVLASTTLSGQTTTRHGLIIPSGDFRLFFTDQRLAQARQWFQANGSSWSPRQSSVEENAADNAFLYLMNGNTNAAQVAINWAANFSFYSDGPGNEARWMGEYQILIFSWLKTLFTAQQRQATIASINRAIAHDLQKAWGGPGDPANNYNWGFTRNAILWGIASYNESYVDSGGRTQREIADGFLDNALITRWRSVTVPFYAGIARGGALPEGSHYGPLLPYYFAVPIVQTRLYNRPLAADTNYWKEAVMGVVYATTQKPTYGSARHNISPRYQVFAYGDEQDNDGFPPAGDKFYGSFMMMAAQEWPDTNIGRYARFWLNRVRPAAEPWFRAVDPAGQTGTPFTSLPLDFYAPGAGYFYTRNTWNSGAADKPTTVLLQLGQATGSHAHCDAGTFQIVRNDRWITRESPGRSTTYPGPSGSGTVSDMTVWAHNGLTVNYSNVGEFCGPVGHETDRPTPNVLRVETHPAYAYAAVDLTPYHRISVAPAIVREFVHVKDLDTLVVFDRVRSTQDVPKTAIFHFLTNPTRVGNVIRGASGSEELRLTSLTSNVPGQTTTFTVIDESTAGGGSGGTWEPQYRLQVDTRGTLDSYHINVLQARTIGDPDVTATLSDTGSAFRVVLSRAGQTTTLTFNKGMASVGGSFENAATQRMFAAIVQPIQVTDQGPVWGTGQPPTAPRNLRILR